MDWGFSTTECYRMCCGTYLAVSLPGQVFFNRSSYAMDDFGNLVPADDALLGISMAGSWQPI